MKLKEPIDLTRRQLLNTGAFALVNSPTFTTPNLGTPSAVNLTNGTALSYAGLASGAIAAGGDFRLACHLADFALEAAPSDAAVQAKVAAIYDKRADTETSLMTINIFNSAAAYAKAGKPYA